MILKLAQKLKLSESIVKELILEHHRLKYLEPKSNLKKLKLNLDKSSLKYVDKICKALQISRSSVVCVAFNHYIINYYARHNE